MSSAGKLSFVDAAATVLRGRGEPMRVRDIWAEIEGRALVETRGKSPENTLRTEILRYSAADDSERRFVRVRPGTYALAEWQLPVKAIPTRPLIVHPSGKRWHAEKHQARQSAKRPGELVAWLVPDDEDRKAVVESFARLMEVAHAARPSAWSFTLKRRSIVLNVGRLTVLQIQPRGVGLALDLARVEADVAGLVRAKAETSTFVAKIAPDLFQGWLSVPDFVELEPAIRPALDGVVERMAAMSEYSSHWRSHSPGVIEYLRVASGRGLPSPVLPEARVVKSADEDSDDEPDYWKISPGKGAELWDEWTAGGYAAIALEFEVDLRGMSDDDFRARVEEARSRGIDITLQGARQSLAFSRIEEGDILVANRGTSLVLGVGRVTGPYEYHPGEAYPHRLPVDWYDRRERQVSMPGWRKTLIPIDPEELGDLLPPSQPGEGGTGTGASGTANGGGPEWATRAASVEELSAAVGFPVDELDRWLRIWERKKQIIIQGPPGTGKTYVAAHLARFKAGATGLVEVVQFHPAYGYEDFIQGIRPEVTKGGQLTYGLVDGSFKGFCARAAAVAPQPAVLVVDEINRANVPRVFGELMYLLEYRGDTVPLAAGGNLRIPNNLFLIGTMNTADRSIARMDHALRRRFAFWRLEPRYETLAARLRARKLAGVDELVGVLRAVNDEIRDPNYAIGISFFMRDDIRTALRDVWEGEIEPYLEEFFFDSAPTVDRFRWARLVGGELAAWRGDE